jgi:pyruvate formate lyase activating enzyme
MLIRKPAKPKCGEANCAVCGKALDKISTCPGVCPECARNRPEEGSAHITQVHAESHCMFGLPSKAPRNPEGALCSLCFHRCRMGEDQRGYCGVRYGNPASMRKDGRSRAQVSFYYDPLPTNCVADWVCPGGTGAGFPMYANDSGPEAGYYNLAVFFEACNFNCLYCQNWTFRKRQLCPQWVKGEALEKALRPDTSCICFFGGDPGPQLPFAFRFAEAARLKNPEKIMRICWETNGAMEKPWLNKMIYLSKQSGGCIKIDLKAWSPGTHHALCGWGNKQVLDNFARVAEHVSERPDPPLLVASTPLVPGYIDEYEVGKLARFIAHINPDIPYALLAFAPQFLMDDSPTTSAEQAQACLKAAKEAGLTRVRIGNRHLLI